MTAPNLLLAAVLLIALPLNWLVALLLLSLSRRHADLSVLRAHAIAALAWALLVTVFSAVFANNSVFATPLLSFEQTQIITRASLLILSTVGALYWLRFVWRTP